MTDLSPEARALLGAARSFDEPGEDDFRRVRVSVLTKVAAGVGAAVGVGTSASYAAGASALLGSAAVKVSAAVLVVAGLAGTYVAVRPHVEAPRAAHVAPTVLAPTNDVPAARPPIDDSNASSVTVHSPTKSRPVAAPQRRRTTADLEGEARLLEEADAELRAGNAQAALRPLAEHAARYPNGALSEEREGIRAIALCRGGRTLEGTAAAERLLSATRKTALASRVRTACNIDKPGN